MASEPRVPAAPAARAGGTSASKPASAPAPAPRARDALPAGVTPPNRFPLTLGKVHATPPGRVAGAGAQPAMLRPQQHLQQAQSSKVQGARQVGPSGLGLDSASVRQRMVQRLRAEGWADDAVLQAMAQVPRHAFIDSALVGQAYEDTSLPIGLSQTISKPSVVARMLSLLMQGGTARDQSDLGKVLEIGTGCGYQAALLCLLARSVLSIERLQPLYERAGANLQSIRGNKLRLVHGDGCLGHASLAPYDSIIAAAGGDELPQAWLDQLAPRGRLVAPMRDATTGRQLLMVVDRRADGSLSRQRQEWVNFVPLKSGIA